MAFTSNFNLHSELYKSPDIKLEIKLKPYDKPPTNRTPVLTGYVLFSRAQLQSIEEVIDASPGGNIAYLRVALWDSKEVPGGVDGVIEYKDYSPHTPSPTSQETEPTKSIFY